MMPEDDELEYHQRQHEAALTIQKHYKGFRVRRGMADQKIMEMEQENEEKPLQSDAEQDPNRLNTAFLKHGHSEESLAASSQDDRKEITDLHSV